MSQQQTPAANQQQAKAPAAPAVPSTPLPLDSSLLHLVGGGTTGPTTYPGTTW